MSKKLNKIPQPVTIDFETRGIRRRPDYPPMPVGVSIKYWGCKARYFAWGHPTKNNCTKKEARAALALAIDYAREAGHGALFQNAKFDIDAIETHFKGMMPLRWPDIHDTMFLLYLHNPHARTFSLKPSALEILGVEPEEQDAVRDWLIANQDAVPAEEKALFGVDRIGPKNFAAFISFAPGDLVGHYANGDVDRTEALFKHLHPLIVEADMLRAYDRERELMPILLTMERQGVPVDLPRLRADVKHYSAVLAQLELVIRKKLGVGPEFNLDSGEHLAAALVGSGMADPGEMGLTPGGKLQTNKKALERGVTDPAMTATLTYYAQLSTCVGTFMKPWLSMAERSGGLIFTTWNQVKNGDGANQIGAKTGRLSSSPNFQNIPKAFAPAFKHLAKDKKEAKGKPSAWAGLKDLPPLPLVRSYVAPHKGEVLIDRDYSQQEPRILAHFDSGSLMDRYNADPWIDFHDFAKAELEVMGLYYERRPVKDTNLGLIYGMGIDKLAAKTGLDREETQALKKAVLSLYPGLKEMNVEMKRRASAGEPIRTWGGRVYYCEPPRLVKGRWKTFDYRMVNTLIQGSAGDCTKEAIIRYWKAKPKNHRLLLQVHDQLVASVPKKDLAKGMEILRKAMESVEFDVPMLTEGTWTDENWRTSTMHEYDKKGVLKYAAGAGAK